MDLNFLALNCLIGSVFIFYLSKKSKLILEPLKHNYSEVGVKCAAV